MKLTKSIFSEKIAAFPVVKVMGICMAMIPIFLLVPLLLKNAINMPIMDQWGTPFHALLKASDGTLSFEDLFAQHNESRMFFPRILFIGMAFITGWDVRFEFLLTFLIACLIAFQVHNLSQITIRAPEFKLFLLTLLANLLIFSPVQFENWLIGLDVVNFIPIACIVTGLITSYSNFGVKLKLLVLVVLCTVSTYSYANGMLSWFVVFPSAIFILRLSKGWESSAERFLMAGGILSCISNLILYFHDYIKPSQTPSFFESLFHPFEAANFFLIFLGSSLSNLKIGTAQIIGLILIILLSSVLCYLLRHRKDRQLLYYSIPWIAIAAYSCTSALVTTVGRLGFGLEAAMPSRYTTFSLYLTISLIYLIAIVTNHLIQSKLTRLNLISRSIIKAFIFVLVALFLTLHIQTYWASIEIMAVAHRDKLHAKACMLFINFVDESDAIKKVIYPWPKLLVPMANRLNEAHFLKPALMNKPDILVSEKRDQYSLGYNGFLDSDSLKKISKTGISISGWAIFPSRKQPADAVVLAYKTSKNVPKVFAIAGVMENSPDVAKALNNPAYQKVRWTKTFEVDRLPKGIIELSAWAFDTETRQMYRLANSRSEVIKLRISDNGLEIINSK